MPSEKTSVADKLEALQREHSSFYLLQWIQGLVSLGCREVNARVHAKGAELCGLQPTEEISWERLDGDLESAVLDSSQPALQNLAVGLLAARPQAKRLRMLTNEAGLEWETSAVAPRKTGGAPGEPHITLYSDIPAKWSNATDQMSSMDESSLLHRCRYSPIPIYVHGRPANALSWGLLDDKAQLEGWPRGELLYRLLECYCPDASCPRRECVAAHQNTATAVENEIPVPRRLHFGLIDVVHRLRPTTGDKLVVSHPRFDTWPHPVTFPMTSKLRRTVETPVCRTILAVPAHLSGPSTLVLVKHGVSTESQTIDIGCPGVFFITSAHGLTTEPFSHPFGIVRDQSWEAALSRLRDNVRLSIPAARRHLHHMRPLADQVGSPLNVGFVTLLGGSVVHAWGPLAWLGGALMCGGALSAWSASRGHKTRNWAAFLNEIDNKLQVLEAGPPTTSP